MTTVTDEMTGAAIEAVWEAVKTDNPPDGWTDWIDDRVMRAALEAAISVMPAPADAEFAAGLFSLSGSATRYGAETMSPRDDTDEWRAVLDALNTEVVEKRRTLLAMHAQAQQQGLIEQIRPSRKEFADHVDTLIQDAYESAMGLGEIGRVDESRREVMRMAGYPEER